VYTAHGSEDLERSHVHVEGSRSRRRIPTDHHSWWAVQVLVLVRDNQRTGAALLEYGGASCSVVAHFAVATDGRSSCGNRRRRRNPMGRGLRRRRPKSPPRRPATSCTRDFRGEKAPLLLQKSWMSRLLDDSRCGCSRLHGVFCVRVEEGIVSLTWCR
jgi:hypothetical protein